MLPFNNVQHPQGNAADRTYIQRIKAKGQQQHARIPFLRSLPLPAVAIVLLLAFVQILAWIAAGIVLRYHTTLVSSAVLAYTLGLRHALDADHIAAIDLMTRRLVASGQRPVTVGTFFSLGHSTIVVITCIVVASTAAAVSNKFGSFSYIGGIIGSSVSATFLLVLGIMNVYIMYKLLQHLQKLCNSPAGEGDSREDFKIEGGGCMFRVLKKMFKLIDRPWKMYPLGIMFGLGFDTSSEVALLGIAAINAANGTDFWLILIFPVLFTAGMCLLDTLDGALMMSLYTSTGLAKDMIAVLYFQSVLTGVTVTVAVVIGTLQMLSMVQAITNATGSFWDGVLVAGDNYDIIGGAICGSFIVFGGISAILYRPWRRKIDLKRAKLREVADTDGAIELDGDDIDGNRIEHGRVEVVAEGSGRAQRKDDHHDDKGDSVARWTEQQRQCGTEVLVRGQ